MIPSVFRPSSLLTVLVVTGTALAAPPTASFLTPSDFTPQLGAAVDLRFRTGTAGDAWPAGQVQWLFVRGGATQENRHDVRPEQPKSDFVALEIKHAGVTLVGVDLQPTILELTGVELRSFLVANAADAAVLRKARALAPQGKHRVRHVASAKTLMRALPREGLAQPSAIATSKTGQAVEMRLLVDPTLTPIGGDVPLRVYVNGEKKTGVKVRATCVATGKAQTFITDSVGSGHFCLNAAGQWRVEVHHARPLEGDDSADWVIHTATLTFKTTRKGAER